MEHIQSTALPETISPSRLFFPATTMTAGMGLEKPFWSTDGCFAWEVQELGLPLIFQTPR